MVAACKGAQLVDVSRFSAGALDSHGRGRWFDPSIAHHGIKGLHSVFVVLVFAYDQIMTILVSPQ